MNFRLEIEMTNDAFEDNPSGQVAVILRTLSMEVPLVPANVGTSFVLRDTNGNTVGSARYVKGE